MFAIHTPQTVELIAPGEDNPPLRLNFRTNGADTSRCVLEIITPDGDVHRLTFTTRGAMVDQQFTAADHAEQDVHLTPEDYMVDGRDTRADNPYTHVAPVDADTAYRDGQTPGYKAPPPSTDAEKEAIEAAGADKLYEEARQHKQELRDAALDRRREREEQAGTWKPDGDLKTTDDTTSRDVAWDAPEPRQPIRGYGSREPYAADKVYPTPGTERRDPADDGSERLAPAPSTGLPGGEPAHPESLQPLAEQEKVSTTRTLNNPPTGRRVPPGVGLRSTEEPADG